MGEGATDQDGTRVEPQGNPDTTDWEAKYREAVAQSRKWEDRAKTNKDAADKLAEAEKGQRSIEERLSQLEGENESLRAARTRAQAVRQAAADTGVPESVVEMLSGNDADELAGQARRISEAMRTPAAPKVPETGRFSGKGGDGDEAKRALAKQIFGNE